MLHVVQFGSVLGLVWFMEFIQLQTFWGKFGKVWSSSVVPRGGEKERDDWVKFLGPEIHTDSDIIPQLLFLCTNLP